MSYNSKRPRSEYQSRLPNKQYRQDQNYRRHSRSESIDDEEIDDKVGHITFDAADRYLNRCMLRLYYTVAFSSYFFLIPDIPKSELGIGTFGKVVKIVYFFL